MTANGFLVLEILHGGSLSLYNNKVNAWADLIALGIENIARHIVADIRFQHRIHPNLVNTCQKCNSIIDTGDQRLFIKIS